MAYPDACATTGASSTASAHACFKRNVCMVLLMGSWETRGMVANVRSAGSACAQGGRSCVHALDQLGKGLRNDLASHLERGGELARLGAQVAVQQLEALDGLERGEPGVQLV